MKHILEEIAIYIVEKMLNYFKNKYDLKDDKEGLNYVAKKIEDKKK